MRRVDPIAKSAPQGTGGRAWPAAALALAPRPRFLSGMDDPHPQWRRTLDAWGAGRVRRALAGEADLGGIDHTFARNWLLAHEIRHALFWARVRTAVLLLFAAASAVLAFDVIVDWLR